MLLDVLRAMIEAGILFLVVLAFTGGRQRDDMTVVVVRALDRQDGERAKRDAGNKGAEG